MWLYFNKDYFQNKLESTFSITTSPVALLTAKSSGGVFLSKLSQVIRLPLYNMATVEEADVSQNKLIEINVM